MKADYPESQQAIYLLEISCSFLGQNHAIHSLLYVIQKNQYTRIDSQNWKRPIEV